MTERDDIVRDGPAPAGSGPADATGAGETGAGETGAGETVTGETGAGETGAGETAADAPGTGTVTHGREASPARRPSPSATAASRARRIGGRPLPGPRPSSDDTEAGRAADPAVVTDRPRRPRPGGQARSATEAPSPERAGRAPRPGRPGSGPRPRRVGEPETAALHRRLARLRWIPAVVAGLAAAAMLAVAAWQSHGVWWGTKLRDTRGQTEQQVLAAAKTCAAAILSYDYRSLDAAERTGQACATGQLKSEYTQTMETTVKQLAPQTKTVQTMQVAKAGVERVSPDGRQWVVLVFGQQAVTNAKTKAGGAPQLQISSPVVTLDRVGDQWLVSNLANAG